MAKITARASILLLVLMMVGCDHATKHAAQANLAGKRPFHVIPGVLDLRYAENHDTAFSLLARFGWQSSALLLAMVAAAVLGVVATTWYRHRREPSKIFHLGFALALAGAIGNVADRFFRGFVVDFIHVKHWPIFNVADMAVVVGMALLFWHGLKKQQPPQPAT